MCYNNQTNVRLSSCISSPITWFICQTIVDCLSLIVYICVLNQSAGHWLLSMFSLMFDPRFKGFCLVFSYVGKE